MTLQKLNIHNVRNLEQLSFTPHHKFNLITGANGSGKTSILEAIYLLGNGRSFHSRETTPIVNFNAEALTVFAEIAKEDTISIQKSKHGTTKVKINHQTCSKTSQLAKLVPCQIIYQDLFQIMDAGPNLRRNLLDWGCFYQFKDYKNIFNDYRHIGLLLSLND